HSPLHSFPTRRSSDLLGAQILGGQVKPAKAREFGRAKLHVTANDPLVHGLPQDTTVWMSHGDQVMELPPQFEAIATTATCPFAADRKSTRLNSSHVAI